MDIACELALEEKPYCDEVDVINVITAPEIEMLIILNEGKYDQFKKSGKKPSEYCKQIFKNENLKSRKCIRCSQRGIYITGSVKRLIIFILRV